MQDVGLVGLGLADYSPSHVLVERSAAGGRFGREALATLRAAAELLPEGCILTLDLTQGLTLTLPRHGALVDMRRDTGRPSLATPTIEEVLLPGPATYSPSDALVRPRVPTLDLAAACGRYDERAAPLVPEGDVLLLQPAHTLVERSARAVDFGHGAPRFAEGGGGAKAAEGDTLWLELGSGPLGRAGLVLSPHGVAFVRQAGRELLLSGAALGGGAALDVPFYD
eukprot:scaffold81321_cov45-Phaeocystis_antarctica.AAC.1